MAQATIYKGQTFQGYIRAQHGVHDAIRFTYAGMTPEGRMAYYRELRSCKDESAVEAVVAEALSLVIQKWDIEYPGKHPDAAKAGKPVPITIAGVSDVMPHVRDKLIGIVTWQTASDIDPQAPIADRLKALRQQADTRSLAEVMGEAEQELRGN